MATGTTPTIVSGRSWSCTHSRPAPAVSFECGEWNNNESDEIKKKAAASLRTPASTCAKKRSLVRPCVSVCVCVCVCATRRPSRRLGRAPKTSRLARGETSMPDPIRRRATATTRNSSASTSKTRDARRVGRWTFGKALSPAPALAMATVPQQQQQQQQQQQPQMNGADKEVSMLTNGVTADGDQQPQQPPPQQPPPIQASAAKIKVRPAPVAFPFRRLCDLASLLGRPAMRRIVQSDPESASRSNRSLTRRLPERERERETWCNRPRNDSWRWIGRPERLVEQQSNNEEIISRPFSTEW